MSYAESYAKDLVADNELVDQLDRSLGGISGKSILDLGSGPGHYSLEFSKRGAILTCLDVSKNYLAIVKRRLDAAGLRANYVVGYLDWVASVTEGGFDAIFCNIAWYYCFNDFSFAAQLLSAVKINGVVMIRETNERFENPLRGVRVFAYWLNRSMGIKIGHTHPPAGRIESAFRAAGAQVIEADYSDPIVEVVIVKRTK